MSTTGNAESYIELRGSLSIPDAIHGKSAYEIAVANGFDGTEEEWLLHLERAQSEEVEEAAEQALTDIANDRQTALSDIANDTQTALSDIENNKQTALTEIETAHTEAMTDAAQALTDIAEAKATMLEEIELAAEIVQTTGDSETAVMSQKATTEAIDKNSIKNIVTTKNLLQFAEHKKGYIISRSTVTGEFVEFEQSNGEYYRLALPAGNYVISDVGSVLNATDNEWISGAATNGFDLTAEKIIVINSVDGQTEKLFSAEYTADEVEALGEYTLGENVLTPKIDERFENNEEQINKNAHEIDKASIKNIVTTKNLLQFAEHFEGGWVKPDGSIGTSSAWSYYILTLPTGDYTLLSYAGCVNLTTGTQLVTSDVATGTFTLDAEAKIAINAYNNSAKKLFSSEYTADEVEDIGVYTSKCNVIPVYNDYDKYGLPVLKFTGDITGMNKDDAVTLNYVFDERSGTCTLKWQGTSSLAYPKKNYTVKFDNAFEAADGWGEQKKYCLKANYIDFSHARNLIGAKLWGAMVQTRTGASEQLLATPNGGAVDGFPICVVINGKYMGLYTFNIPKDGWMFSMGDGANEGIVCAEQPTENGGIVCKWESADVVLGRDYDVEYAPDEDNVEWMQTSLRTLIQTCIDTDGTNLAALEAVLDVNSAIDYYIFSLLTNNYDGITKNHLLATYDGTKWMFGAYDMDCLFGMWWDGSKFRGNEIIGKNAHGAFKVITTYYKDELKARYQALREDVLSEENLALVLTNFVGSIPKALLDEEVKIWTGLLNTNANNYSQMLEWYRRQVIKADAYINSL